jgi:hypothetical protein
MRTNAGPLKLFEKLKRRGFRKWHERQLIDSHLQLALGFLGLILAVAGLELFTDRTVEGRSQLLNASCIGVGSVICWLSWKRYRDLMLTAQWIGHQAVCPSCARVGFKISDEDLNAARSEQRGDDQTAHLQVFCPQCATRWTLSVDPNAN